MKINGVYVPLVGGSSGREVSSLITECILSTSFAAWLVVFSSVM